MPIRLKPAAAWATPSRKNDENHTPAHLQFFFILSIASYFLIDALEREIRPRYLEAVENAANDMATILAAGVEAHSDGGRIRTDNLSLAMSRAHDRTLGAKIYRVKKGRIDTHVYVTDEKGIVVFDSRGEALGKDYSRWNDVYKTLRGEYGARSTRIKQNDASTGSMYVAAPIHISGKVAGVLTVIIPNKSVDAFIQSAEDRLFQAAVVVILGIAVITAASSIWVTRPLHRLLNYVEALRAGRPVLLPRLGSSEIGDLGRSFESMRRELEGKRYVEEYVQNLTHELKSPVTAVRGAAELLRDDPESPDRTRFIENILRESARMDILVQTMQRLVVLEHRQEPAVRSDTDVNTMLDEIAEGASEIGREKQISIVTKCPPGLTVEAEGALLYSAVRNLVQNAVEFSPAGGEVKISALKTKESFEIVIEDEGPGLPSYAVGRAFDRFFSLPRPGTGQRSSGLGLPLVRQVARIHRGEAFIENRPSGGARAVIRLPG